VARTAREHPMKASVVIIGGGVIGVSTAYYLAAAGVNDVVVVDKGSFGSGSTCKAAGGVRAQFSDRGNIELGLRSLRTFEQNVALQNELGVPSLMISAAEAKRMSPLIETEGLLAATYSPTDGHCTPESVVLGYVSGARRHGARLIANCAATGIETTDGQIVAVNTEVGCIETDTVICGTGPWSRRIGEWVGVELPITPLRRQILITECLPELDPRTPFTIDFNTSYYFHREGRGPLMGMSDPNETPGFKLTRSDSWLPGLSEAMERRTPTLVDTGIASGWAGLYEMTPDHNALIGEADGVHRFLYATGFSGHGFLMGPAVGEVMRDLYLGKKPFVDVGGLDARRFTEPVIRSELNIV